MVMSLFGTSSLVKVVFFPHDHLRLITITCGCKHICSEGNLTKYQFNKAIAVALPLRPITTPVTSSSPGLQYQLGVASCGTNLTCHWKAVGCTHDSHGITVQVGMSCLICLYSQGCCWQFSLGNMYNTFQQSQQGGSFQLCPRLISLVLYPKHVGSSAIGSYCLVLTNTIGNNLYSLWDFGSFYHNS